VEGRSPTGEYNGFFGKRIFIRPDTASLTNLQAMSKLPYLFVLVQIGCVKADRIMSRFSKLSVTYSSFNPHDAQSWLCAATITRPLKINDRGQRWKVIGRPPDNYRDN